jgi:hypothetical protein
VSHPLATRDTYQRYLRSEEIIAIALELDSMWANDLNAQLDIVEKFFLQYVSSGDVMSFPWESNVQEMHPLELLTFKAEALNLYVLTAKWLGFSGMQIHRINQDVITQGRDRQEREAIFQKLIRSSKTFGGEAIALLHHGIELWMATAEEEIKRRDPSELKQALAEERRLRGE